MPAPIETSVGLEWGGFCPTTSLQAESSSMQQHITECLRRVVVYRPSSSFEALMTLITVQTTCAGGRSAASLWGSVERDPCCA